jgi:hypothetical protein
MARRKLTPFRRAIIDGYAAGERPADIAARFGTTENVVRATASSLGVTDTHPDSVAARRGFSVPRHLRAEYRQMVRNEHREPRVAAQALGLIPNREAA